MFNFCFNSYVSCALGLVLLNLGLISSYAFYPVTDYLLSMCSELHCRISAKASSRCRAKSVLSCVQYLRNRQAPCSMSFIPSRSSFIPGVIESVSRFHRQRQRPTSIYTCFEKQYQILCSLVTDRTVWGWLCLWLGVGLMRFLNVQICRAGIGYHRQVTPVLSVPWQAFTRFSFIGRLWTYPCSFASSWHYGWCQCPPLSVLSRTKRRSRTFWDF